MIGRVLLRKTDHQIDDADVVDWVAHGRTIDALFATLETVAAGTSQEHDKAGEARLVAGSKGATPAMIVLRRAGVPFKVHEFAHDPAERHYGKAAADALGVEPDRVFKTLLASLDGVATIEGLPPANTAIGIVPVSGQLSLKELAAALGVKRAEMCDPTVAQRLTGYVVGGISPFGQRKLLPAVIDETCLLFDTIFVSGGKRGLDIEIAPADLIAAIHAVVAPIGTAR